MTTSQWTAIPRAVVPDRVAALRVKVVIAAALFAAVAGPCSLAVSLARSAAPTSTATTYRYAGFAQIAATDYLSGRNTSLPRVQDLPASLGRDPAPGSNGSVLPIPATNLALDRSRLEALGDETVEIHTFVFTSDGRLFNLAVSVMATDNGPVIASLPTFGPARVAPTVRGIDMKSLGVEAAPDTAAMSQIKAWATAFAAGDGEDLYRLTGDTQQRRYLGLGGFILTSQPSVLSSIAKGSKQLVQIRLSLRNIAQPGVVLTTDYDLLLTGRGKKQNPDIAAWGPAGTGMTLEPFQNAVYYEASLDQNDTTATTQSTQPLYVPEQPEGASEPPPDSLTSDGSGQ